MHVFILYGSDGCHLCEQALAICLTVLTPKQLSEIDIIDQTLRHNLGKRMKISDNIGEIKRLNNVAVLQNKRWNEILGKMILEGEKLYLSEEFILKFFKAIHQESINRQEKVINK